MYTMISFLCSSLCFREKMLPSCEVYGLNLWKIRTENGYILSLKRIPHGPSNGDNSTYNENTRPPVMLFHGLMVARTLFEKLCTFELHFHAYLNNMCGLDKVSISWLGYSKTIAWLYSGRRRV
jgi:hypothetical protein